MSWEIYPNGSWGKLTFDNTTMGFSSPPVLSAAKPLPDALGEPRPVATDRLRKALLAVQPAAATDRDGLLSYRQVEVVDGCARAANGRMFAYHRDSASIGCRLRVARGDIETLAALMRCLDPTASTLRSDGEMFLFEDGRLSVGFKQPNVDLPMWRSTDILPISMKLECATDDFRRLLKHASILIPSTAEAKQGLQVQLTLALNADAIVLRASALWARNRLWRTDIGVVVANEHAQAVRERLEQNHQATGDTSMVSGQNRDVSELPTPILPPSGHEEIGDAGNPFRSAEPAQPSIELGRYPYAELASIAGRMRTSLLHVEFVDAKAVILSEAAAEHATIYLVSARTEDTTPGLPKRKLSKRWGESS